MRRLQNGKSITQPGMHEPQLLKWLDVLPKIVPGAGFGWEASPAQTHPSIIDIIKTTLRRTIRNIIGQSLTCQSNCAGAQLACFPTLLSNHEERLPKRAFKIKGPTTNIQKKAV